MSNETKADAWPAKAIGDLAKVKSRSPFSVLKTPIRCRLEPGMIMITQGDERFRSRLGDGSIIEIAEPYAILEVNRQDEILPEFLAIALEGRGIFKSAQDRATSRVSHNPLRCGDISWILELHQVPVPPIDQQQEIIKASSTYLRTIEEMAENYIKMGQNIKLLKEAIQGQMISRKMEKAEVRELLSFFRKDDPAQKAETDSNSAQSKPKAKAGPSP